MSAAPVATVVNGNTYTIDPRYDLSESRILGKGSFGVVCTAYDTVRQIHLAIKRIRPYANDEWDAKHTLREVRLMRVLGPHPNVITLYELSLFLPKTELYMMIEEMDSDLHRVIQSSKPLTLRHHKCFLKQLLEGIKAMHSIGVLHRDLKPGNILVSKDCQLRITDFGLARFIDEKTKRGENKLGPMTQYVVTRWYRPPELLLAPNLPYGEAVDLWSIGCILAEMTNRKALFPGKDHLNQVDLIFSAFGYTQEQDLGFPIDSESAQVLKKLTHRNRQPFTKLCPNATPDAINMLELLLSIDPRKRPTAEQALLHPFLADAEVLHDYSKTYVSKPPPEYFEFEHTAFTVPDLRAMIHQEVRELAADAYQTPDTGRSQQAPSSPEAERAYTVAQPVRRRSEAEMGTEPSSEQKVPHDGSNVQDAMNAEGPASQLPTVRLQQDASGAAGVNHDGMLNRSSSSDGTVPPRDRRERRDNPFRSTVGTQTSTENSGARIPGGASASGTSSGAATGAATGAASALPVANPAGTGIAERSVSTGTGTGTTAAAAAVLHTESSDSAVSERTLARAINEAMRGGGGEEMKHSHETLASVASAGPPKTSTGASGTEGADKAKQKHHRDEVHAECCTIC